MVPTKLISCIPEFQSCIFAFIKIWKEFLPYSLAVVNFNCYCLTSIFHYPIPYWDFFSKQEGIKTGSWWTLKTSKYVIHFGAQIWKLSLHVCHDFHGWILVWFPYRFMVFSFELNTYHFDKFIIFIQVIWGRSSMPWS